MSNRVLRPNPVSASRLWGALLKVALPALLIISGHFGAGCGGGGGGSTTSTATATTSTGGTLTNVPSTKTKADVAENFTAYGEAEACPSFIPAGKVTATGGHYFDVALGLYGTLVEAPSQIRDLLFVDSGRTQLGGEFEYNVNEIAKTSSGSISITSGRFSGLTGTFFQALQTNGFEGSLTLTFENGALIDNQFVEVANSSNQETGSATIGISLPGGYSQTELATYNPDGSMTLTSTDGASCRGSLSFAADLSGTATITGTDPGLPATATWNSQGTGQVRFADGSLYNLSTWQLQS